LGEAYAHGEYGDWSCSAVTVDGDIVVTSDSCAEEELVDYTPFDPDDPNVWREVKPSITLLTKQRQSVDNADGSPSGISVVPLAKQIDPLKSLRLAIAPRFPTQAAFVYSSDMKYYAKLPDCNVNYADGNGSISSD